MYKATTKNISISVKTDFIEEQLDERGHYFLWAYHIHIKNESKKRVKLLSRHWKITDAKGRVEEVKGDGVVGLQPTLNPGETFSYSSGAPLTTSSGFMNGSYMMQLDNGKTFDVNIPSFPLDTPKTTLTIH